MEKEEIILDAKTAIEFLKDKLEVNAGRLCEPILKQNKDPRTNDECHKAFIILAHLQEIEDYFNMLDYRQVIEDNFNTDIVQQLEDRINNM